MTYLEKTVGIITILLGFVGFYVIEPKKGFEIINRLALIYMIIFGSWTFIKSFGNK